MRRLLVLAAAAAALVPHASAAAVTPDQAANLGRQAYLYGLPLLEFLRVRATDTRSSIAQLDLGRGPVVLSHPDMGRRYFVFELLDPYTNVIGYIGTRTTGARAGRFAITWKGGPVRGAETIRSPARRVWVIGRT